MWSVLTSTFFVRMCVCNFQIIVCNFKYEVKPSSSESEWMKFWANRLYPDRKGKTVKSYPSVCVCVSPILFETRASSSIIFIQRCTQVTGSEHNYHVQSPSEIGLLPCHSPGLLSGGQQRINFLEYKTRSLSLTS